jgi:hypothetical protein
LFYLMLSVFSTSSPLVVLFCFFSFFLLLHVILDMGCKRCIQGSYLVKVSLASLVLN